MFVHSSYKENTQGMCRGCVGDVQGMCRGCAGGVQGMCRGCAGVWMSLLGSITQYTSSKHGAHDMYRMTGRRVGSRMGGGWDIDRRRVGSAV